MEYYSRLVLKKVINKHFTFADLSPKFKGVDSSTGNIFCPFHDNHDTPAAKMYWDESREIWVLHCFGQCHRNFTAFDYVELILCEKYRKYSSPYHFLKANMDERTLSVQLSVMKDRVKDLVEEDIEEKRVYIDNTFYEEGNIIDFIEKLYTA